MPSGTLLTRPGTTTTLIQVWLKKGRSLESRHHLGVSTWDKPAELEGIDFTDPVPDIEQVKENIKASQALEPLSPVNEELDYNDIIQELDAGMYL